MKKIQTVLSVIVLAMIGVAGWFLIDWHTVGQIMLHAKPLYLFGCITIYFVGVWLSCVRWKILLDVQELHTTMPQLIRWYLIGALAGSVLPSDVGGDLGRGYLAGRAFNNKVAAWSSVFGERLAGLAALLILGAVTLLVAPTLLGWSASVPVGMLSAGLVVGVIGSISLQSHRLAETWMPQRVQQMVEAVRAIWERYNNRPDALLACLGVSLTYHILNCISLWILLLAVVPQGVSWRVGLVMPLVGLIGVVPMTPGGLGVREGTFALLLERSGVSPEHAIAAALLSRVLIFLATLSGLPPLLTELRTNIAVSDQQN